MFKLKSIGSKKPRHQPFVVAINIIAKIQAFVLIYPSGKVANEYRNVVL